MTRIAWLACLTAALMPLVSLDVVAAPKEDLAGRELARQTVEKAQSAKMAGASPTALLGSYFSVEGDRQSTVLLLNKILDPVLVELEVFSPNGNLTSLGEFIVESGHHLELSVEELLAASDRVAPQTGSIAVRYVGYESLQGWVILRDGKNVAELPLYPEKDIVGAEWTSFWDSSGSGGTPQFFVSNMDIATAEILIRTGKGQQHEETVVTLPAGSRYTFRPTIDRRPLVSGWVELVPSQGAERVVLSGLVQGPTFLAALPPANSPRPTTALSFDAVRTAGDVPQDRGKTNLVVFNPSEERELRATIWWVSAETGALTFSRELRVQPREAKAAIAPPAPRISGEFRIRVEAPLPFAVYGANELDGGGQIELGLFASDAGHATGSYPILDPERYEVFTTLVNLGFDPANVVGQIRWNGGSYSFGPIEIPAGGSRRVDFSQLAALGQPDLRGRTLDPAHPKAGFRWLSQGPSRQLIARTEARPLGTEDSFGFNCLYCCYEYPFGEIVPAHVEFSLGQTVNFHASVNYETCDGPMGPYANTPVSMTTPAPFTWDGQQLSASAAANANLSFSGGFFEGLSEWCQSFWEGIFGDGRAEMCQETHNPNDYNEGQTCTSQTTGCQQCQGCCNDIYDMRICEGVNADLATSEKNACIGHCLTDRC